MEFLNKVVDRINQKQADVYGWLENYEKNSELPLYTSVDMRDAGFKVAAVDTNLFPAGFNNLCEHGLGDAVLVFREAILKRVPECKNILILAEEHTRNTWYLENVRILKNIIEQAGFSVWVATFLEVKPEVCRDCKFIELETATGHPLRVHSIDRVVREVKSGNMSLDLIVMNNDLTSGIPDLLKQSDIPIYPSIQAGWHSRLKSHHFKHTADLIREFAHILEMDPWLFSCFDATVDSVSIQNEADRQEMMDVASDLFSKIKAKYAEHDINEKPFLFLKSDSGTYGMGVQPIEDPLDILNLNKKGRKKLSVGKSSQQINRFLLQEGVPTKYVIDQLPSEVCVYQVDNQLIGGFYRTHSEKSARQSLNSKGMGFKTMCPHLEKYGHCGAPTEANSFDLYRIIARIAGIAAQREIATLESEKSV